MIPKRGDFFDPFLFANPAAVPGADSLRPAHGQAADRADGGVGICGDHAGSQPGRHSHAGWGDSPLLRSGAHSHGAGDGAGAVGADSAQCAPAPPAVRQAGDSHQQRQNSLGQSAPDPDHPGRADGTSAGKGRAGYPDRTVRHPGNRRQSVRISLPQVCPRLRPGCGHHPPETAPAPLHHSGRGAVSGKSEKIRQE